MLIILYLMMITYFVVYVCTLSLHLIMFHVVMEQGRVSALPRTDLLPTGYPSTSHNLLL
jgi:hypothetical protein